MQKDLLGGKHFHCINCLTVTLLLTSDPTPNSTAGLSFLAHLFPDFQTLLFTPVKLFFQPVSISGWGDTGVQDTSTDKLQETILPIVPNSNCIERMNETEGVDENLIVCGGGAAEGPCKVCQTIKQYFT